MTSQDPTAKSAASHPLQVLVADDVEEITNLLRQWLEDEGHSVTAAADGREIIALVQQRPFDILVTDLVMPGVDGWDAILAVCRIRPETRILAISGGGKQMPTEACLRLARGVGADLALHKPFRRSEFLDAFSKLAVRVRTARGDKAHT